MTLAMLLEKNTLHFLTSRGKLWTKPLGKKKKENPGLIFWVKQPQKPSFTFCPSGLSWRRWYWSERARRENVSCSISLPASCSAILPHTLPQVSLCNMHENVKDASKVIPLVGILRVCAGSDMCLDASQHWLAWTGKKALRYALSHQPFSHWRVCEQHVGKPMSSSKFVSNLDGMNEGGNFNKDLLKVILSRIYSLKAP